MIDKKVFEIVDELQKTSNGYIFNNNIALLNLFYEYCKKHLPISVAEIFLTKFTSIELISTSNIEKFFYETIMENCGINCDNLKKFRNKNGIYFLYNRSEIVYIGHSSNVEKRALQSYICKLPYGVDCMKIMDLECEIQWCKYFENILIDIVKPILNQTHDSYGIDFEQKYNFTKKIIKALEKQERFSYNFNLLFDGDNNVFDDIEDCF